MAGVRQIESLLGSRQQEVHRPSRRRLRLALIGFGTAAVAVTAAFYYFWFFVRVPERPSPLFRSGEQILNLRLVGQQEPRNPEWSLLLGETFAADGHYLSAIEALKQSLRLGGPEERIRRRLGACYSRLDQHELALAEVQRVCQLNPRALGPILTLANIRLDMGQPKKAREIIAGIPLDSQGRPLVNPGSPDEREARLRTREGRAQVQRADDPEALEHEPALQRETIAAAFARAGDWRRALALSQKSIRCAPERFGGYITAGQALVSLGRAPEAVRFFKPVRLNADFRELTATCLLQRNKPGDRQEAQRELEEAVRLSPTQGRGWWKLAGLYAERGAWLKATEAYGRADQLGTENPRAMKLAGEAAHKAGQVELEETLLGAYYQESGQPEKALELYQSRLRHHPDDELAYRQVAGALRALGRQKEHLRLLLAARRRFPKSAALAGAIAKSYSDLGDGQRTLDTLEQAAIAPGGDDFKLRTLLASAYNNLGRVEDAERVYRGLLPNNTQSISLRRALAQILLAKRDNPRRLREAVQVLEASLPLAPDDDKVYRDLGLAYSYVGRSQEAIWALRHAVDLAPGNGLTYQPLGDLLAREGHAEEATWMLGLAKRYREFVRAGDVLRGRAKRRPPKPEDQRALARFYYHADAPTQAEREYRRLLKLLPNDREARERLGELYDTLGRSLDRNEVLAGLPRS
jgi:tetratricopeptide (TPR) repeat protein